MRILIVEDSVRLADAVARGLRRRSMAVDVSHDGADGLFKATEHDYDVVVLDRDLPALHGDEVCRRLRDVRPDALVLMLTAASSNDELVAGLGLGADDYLTKPFEFEVLVARLEALGRRARPYVPSTLVFGSLEVDAVRLIATRHGEELPLTPREFAVLHALARADGAPLSAEDLFEQAWDERADPFTGSVRVIISRLRAKLGDPPPIETLVGRGYRLVVE